MKSQNQSSGSNLTMSLFQHLPLTASREIRVLVLQPGLNDSLIYCQLEHVRLDTNPTYEALSYVWGDDTLNKRIHVNNDLPLMITTSLYNALRSLRHNNKEKRLWADGICINQNDKEEKVKQIALFRDVYTQASRVVTYIGENNASTDRALDLADQISEYIRRYKDDPDRPDMTAAIFEHGIDSLGFPAENDPIWEELRKVFRREWSSRNWIVQESLLNPNMTMYCGRRNIAWNKLPNIIHYAKEGLTPPMALMSEAEYGTLAKSNFSNISTGQNTHANLAALNHIRRDIITKGQEKTLLDLLEGCLRFDCKDKRDKVYSLLGVASDKRDLNIVPNYNNNNTLQNVYTEAAVRIIKVSGSLDILSNVKPKKRVQGLPSWVPDWSPVTGSPISGLLFGIKRSGNQPYLASGNSTASITNSHESITLQARVLDTIVWRSATIKNIPEGKDQIMLQNWHSKVRASKQYGGGRAANDAFWRILVANITHDRKKAGADYEDYFAGWCEVEELQFTPNWPGGSDVDLKQISFFQAALLSSLFWRRFCMTGERYACLAPDGVQNGDFVCLLKGARTPFIIREQSGQYVLVGEAYVHGLMHGEGLNIPGTNWESIKIL